MVLQPVRNIAPSAQISDNRFIVGLFSSAVTTQQTNLGKESEPDRIWQSKWLPGQLPCPLLRRSIMFTLETCRVCAGAREYFWSPTEFF
jgi:hypothetical protein